MHRLPGDSSGAESCTASFLSRTAQVEKVNQRLTRRSLPHLAAACSLQTMLRASAPLRSPLRRRPARFANSVPPSPPPPPPFSRRVGPQVAFTAGGVSLALGTAVYLTNRDTLARSPSSALHGDPSSNSSGVFTSWRRRLTTGLSPTLSRQRADEAYAQAAHWVRSVGQGSTRLAVIAAENWLEAGEARRTALGLVASFAGVWVAWRFNARGSVARWWAHDALSGRSVTLLTSTFSHRVRSALLAARAL